MKGLAVLGALRESILASLGFIGPRREEANSTQKPPTSLLEHLASGWGGPNEDTGAGIWFGPRNDGASSPLCLLFLGILWTGCCYIGDLKSTMLEILTPWNLISQWVQSLSHVWLFAAPWTAARQAFLSITKSWSLPKLMSMESVMPSNHLMFCRPLLLRPSIFPSIRVFSN